MEKQVYETPFTEKMEVEVEGNFCSSNEPAEVKKSTIEVESYSEFGVADKKEVENEIGFY